MLQDPENVLTPKLRFREFCDQFGWKETLLANVLTEHAEKNDDMSEVHSVSVHKGIINQVEHLGRSFAAANRSNYSLVKPHDIVYTKSPTGNFPYGIVKQNSLQYNVIVSPLYSVFSPVNKHLGYILDAYFESPVRTHNYLASLVQKGAKNTLQISSVTFLSKSLYLPSIEAEQKKVAACLSTLDELIVTEQRKLVALQNYKKGLMRQLFPIEGENVPRFRFPDYQNSVEWRTKCLADVCAMKAGEFVRAAEIKQQNSKELYSCYGGNGLRGYTLTYTHDGVHPIIGRQGALCGNVKLCTGKFHATEHAVVASPKMGVDVVWLFYALNFLALNRFATGLAQPGLSVDVLDRVVLMIPEQESEQQRIASYLHSVEEQINAQSAKLEVLKTHKNGLMQQLFPSAAETVECVR